MLVFICRDNLVLVSNPCAWAEARGSGAQLASGGVEEEGKDYAGAHKTEWDNCFKFGLLPPTREQFTNSSKYLNIMVTLGHGAASGPADGITPSDMGWLLSIRTLLDDSFARQKYM